MAVAATLLDALEDRAAALRGPLGARGNRVSFSAGYQQVEQDRTAALRANHAELAWQAFTQPSDGREPDRKYDTTTTGLRVRSKLDTRADGTARKVSKAEFDSVRLQRDTFHGEWNYTVMPRTPGV